MNIIPVIDIKDKIAVHGKSGERDKYKPLKSVICDSPNPIDVAMTYKEKGAETTYIADLNAIVGDGNNFNIIKKINFIRKIVDAGIKNKNDLEYIKNFLNKGDKVIIATETLKDIKLLNEKDIIVSLDFKNGNLLNYSLDDILKHIKKNTPIIVLDISLVGTQKGINVDLIKDIMDRTDNPIYVGGGIRGINDLKVCYRLGVDAVLIATAIHKGILNLERIIRMFNK